MKEITEPKRIASEHNDPQNKLEINEQNPKLIKINNPKMRVTIVPCLNKYLFNHLQTNTEREIIQNKTHSKIISLHHSLITAHTHHSTHTTN